MCSPLSTDVRFPLLHYPPSLRAYLHTLKPRKPLVLVLTKCDLVPRWLAEAWKTWLEETEGEGVSVVLMESYREEERGQDTQGSFSHSSHLSQISISDQSRSFDQVLNLVSFLPHHLPHVTHSSPHSEQPMPHSYLLPKSSLPILYDSLAGHRN